MMRLACRWSDLKVVGLLGYALVLVTGCSKPSQGEGNAAAAPKTKPVPPVFEVKADSLLANRLSTEEASQGWVRLFDGHSLFGWEMASAANWQVKENAIVVDSGEPGLLCTSVGWADFELKLEFLADAETNSGIFLRTPLEPTDPGLDCYEVNIAPPSNPFPTGSIVKRARVESGKPGETTPLDPASWHTYEMTMIGGVLTLKVNGEKTSEYRDPSPLPTGRIGLQLNSGKVAFRDIKIRPIGLKPLIDRELSRWKKFPDKPGEFTIDEEGNLHVTGGRGQIESDLKFANIVSFVEGKTQSEKLNSGLFYRCVDGSNMDGYECQINHGIVDGNPLKPVDCGTGGIFRRQDARIVAANDREWFSMLFVADGLQFAAWVNGIQVTDWRDARKPDANPRNGSRTEAGSIMVQAHDPTTDILFRKIEVAELVPAVGAVADDE